MTVSVVVEVVLKVVGVGEVAVLRGRSRELQPKEEKASNRTCPRTIP